MKRCSVRPYEGTENYIFVSYCHQDKKQVYPIIERLARDGYRVWYDEGIDPGADWPEVIADHLSRCALCIAFLSENALNSHNCRREINFTLLKRKPLISVAIENVSMSPGMQMQLSSAQSIPKAGMSDDEFFAVLYRSPLLASSLGEPDHSIRISTAEDYDDSDPAVNGGMSGASFSDMWFSEHNSSVGYESRKVNVTYHPTYRPDPQTIRATPVQKSEHTKVYSKEEFNREAALKPVRMKSNIRKAEEIPQPIQNDSQKHLKWLIPLMIILMVLALILSIVAVVLSRSGNGLRTMISEIAYISDTIENKEELTELNNIKISPEGYHYDDTGRFFKGVVFHGDYTMAEGVSDDFFRRELSCRINLDGKVLEDEFTIGDENDEGSFNPFFSNKEFVFSLSKSTDELTPGDYSVEVGASDEYGFSVLFSIDFSVKPVTANEYHTSFTLNDVCGEIDLKNYHDEYVEFFNGYLTKDDESGYQLSVKEGEESVSYRVVIDEKSSPDEKENLDAQCDRYVGGVARICSGEEPSLQITKIRSDPRTYMSCFVDWDADQVKQLLTDSGIRLKIEYDECEDASLSNKVKNQSVRRGCMMKKDTSIGLTVYRLSTDQEPSETIQKPDGSCKQKLIVTAEDGSSLAVAELMEYTDGEWKSVKTYQAAVGRGGIGTASEGSGKTPQGTFMLGTALVKDDITAKIPTHPATENTGFVSYVESPFYNQVMEREDYSEGIQFDPIYDEFANAMIIIEFNGNGFSSENVVAGAGSAIGLRGKAGELSATYGDVDISEEDMEDLLSRLDPAKIPMIEIGN